MIKRELESKILSFAQQYPVVTITGPRQSGKTTLCKKLFADKEYFSLENLTTRNWAQNDPIGFLSKCCEKGAVIDEFQKVPDLCSYIQGIVDEKSINGQFILTGSQNFELMNQVSQSLAGRTALARLLPFSYSEIYKDRRISIDEVLYTGFYPRIFDQNLNPTEAMSFYLSTYLERDVRGLLNIRDLSTFEVFLKLCASRTGQILNLASISDECGISHNTAKSWLSVLEASHIIFLLRPHFKNFKKRLIKSPKLYFTDIALALYLLDVESVDHVSNHPLKGAFFESFIVAEFLKNRFNKGKKSNLYYFRDSNGNEIDIVVDKGTMQIPVEIKVSQTIREDFFKTINMYKSLNSSCSDKGVIIYGGNEEQFRTENTVIPYNLINSLEF